MAVITGSTTNFRPRHKITILSDAALPEDSVELSDVFHDSVNIELAVRFFDSGGAAVAATAGTFVIELLTVSGDPVFEKPSESTITALAPTTVVWSAHTSAIKVTPTGLVGPTTWRVALTLS